MQRTTRTIIFLSYHFPPEVGGIQTRISNYCENLTSRGIEVVVLFPAKSTKRIRNYEAFGAKVISLPGRAKFLLSDASLFAQLAVLKRSNVIHVFTGSSTALGLFGILIGRVLNIPSALSVFGREDVTFDSVLSRTIFLLSGEIATTILANSEATRNLLPRKLQRKCHILLGGAKFADQKNTLVANEDKKTVLFVGRLAKRKGIDDLLNAFEFVEKRIPEARLVIVGDGPERNDLRRRAEKLGLKQVKFKGALFGESLNQEYARCAVCVLPSKSVPGDTATEGLGLTLIEASMHAKPLIGTKHGGIPEIIRDGENGFLVEEGNWKALSDAIAKLLLNDELASKMGRNAFRMSCKQFSWDAATARLLESYKK